METTATSGYNTRCEMQVKSGGSWKKTKGSWIKINDEWHKFGGGVAAATIDEAASSSSGVTFETLDDPFSDGRNFMLVRFETVGTYTLSVSDAGIADLLLIGGGAGGSGFGAPGNTSAGGAGGGSAGAVVEGKFFLEEGDTTIVVGDKSDFSTITSPSGDIMRARPGHTQGSFSNAGGWGSTTINQSKSGGYGTQSDITGVMLPYAGGGGAGSNYASYGQNAGSGRDGGGNGQMGTGGGNGYPATTFGSGGGGAAWRFPDQSGSGGAGYRGVAYVRVEI